MTGKRNIQFQLFFVMVVLLSKNIVMLFCLIMFLEILICNNSQQAVIYFIFENLYVGIGDEYFVCALLFSIHFVENTGFILNWVLYVDIYMFLNILNMYVMEFCMFFRCKEINWVNCCQLTASSLLNNSSKCIIYQTCTAIYVLLKRD